ncbi:MAG: 2,3-bisphosphoglycerate-independent phosphoglycerate mutase [Candidatus Krumholzibacteria bacterium]|nr:2,3-bisphosphoglycerate-independent phosphoglycerate mutase [Candidatus Krumholzibacteria bacterium]
MTDKTNGHPKVVLCILDGVGYRTGPGSEVGNAVIGANPAYYNSLFADYPFTTLDACGLHVGLPEGQMGNSEVGHLTIGAGRVMNQELVRISESLIDGEFQTRAPWTEFIDRALAGTGRLHLLGLVSPGGVHSHTDHLKDIIAAAHDAGVKEIYVHAFLDGRDTDPRSGEGYVADVVAAMEDFGAGQIASVCGRYWAMDRDKRWDRVQRAWNLLVNGTVDEKGSTATDPVAAIAASYAAGITDEFVEPTLMTGPDGQPVATIDDGDSVFFWNFRADRARELTWAFKQDGFDGFDVSGRPAVNYLTMTPYDEKMDLPSVFQPERPQNGLAEVLAAQGLTNLRTAETEKYAHVTYFFNGGREEPFPGEDRRMVASPKVATYDLQPEMSAPEVAAIVNEACQGTEFDVVIVNFANGDMVGHTGVYDAAVAAIQTLDRLLAEIMPPSLDHGTVWLVTADHGNCDEMLGADGSVLTQHSLQKVPLVVAAQKFKGQANVLKDGNYGLSDIAPTILDLLDIEQPNQMTGQTILKYRP